MKGTRNFAVDEKMKMYFFDEETKRGLITDKLTLDE